MRREHYDSWIGFVPDLYASMRRSFAMPYTLADVMPSVAASFGLPAHNPFRLEPSRDVVVLLIDGLGATLLARHADVAPTLASHVRETLTTGFPATTATSLTSLALGAPCAVHGIVGYSFAMPDPGGPRLFNSLRWRLDSATGDDARAAFPPESVQPERSRLEILAADGVEIHYVIPAYQQRSGLTAAAFRAPGTLHAATSLDEVRNGILSVATHSDANRRFAYAHFPDLDATGHLLGPESPEWLAMLGTVDAYVADLLGDLPDSCTLLVTGDHGMIHAHNVIDLDADLGLHRSVRLIGGEPRARHVYLKDTAALDDVQQYWAHTLADDASVVSRQQAIDEHWFGPTPPNSFIANRIGDLIAVAEGNSVLVRTEVEPIESGLVGHHGARTPDEQLVPLITRA